MYFMKQPREVVSKIRMEKKIGKGNVRHEPHLIGSTGPSTKEARRPRSAVASQCIRPTAESASSWV